MRKLITIILILSILFTFTSCKNEKEETQDETKTKKQVTTQEPEYVAGEPSNQELKPGETLTGLKPLKEVTMTAEDPCNTRGLDTTGHGYGYGAAKDGKPNDLSVDNQKYFDPFGALALDTKTKKKVLYLTFDCGYENGNTEQILDILKEKNVPAAFFVTLDYLKENLGQNMAIRMIKEGHIVGNHSTNHPIFPKISRADMAKEIETCDNYLRTNFGYTSPFFRFPTGEYSECSLELVQSLGYMSVFWSVAYLDYGTYSKSDNQKAFEKITSRLHPGAVILLHAISSTNASVLSDVIDWARDEGYTFAALTEYKS